MNDRDEKLVERRVTYTLQHEGKFYIVENVPAASTSSQANNISPPTRSNTYRERFWGRVSRTA